jgi:hypothetical protein
MPGKGQRRREKNYRAAHGGESRLPPPPKQRELDALPSKLRRLIAIQEKHKGGEKGAVAGDSSGALPLRLSPRLPLNCSYSLMKFLRPLQGNKERAMRRRTRLAKTRYCGLISWINTVSLSTFSCYYVAFSPFIWLL